MFFALGSRLLCLNQTPVFCGSVEAHSELLPQALHAVQLTPSTNAVSGKLDEQQCDVKQVLTNAHPYFADHNAKYVVPEESSAVCKAGVFGW